MRPPEPPSAGQLLFAELLIPLLLVFYAAMTLWFLTRLRRDRRDT